jgi:hypothetical protein
MNTWPASPENLEAMNSIALVLLPRFHYRALVTTMVSLSLVLSGCTTLQNVPLPVSLGDTVAVHIGDQVKAQRRDGTTLVFQVTNIEPDALRGKDVTVRYADLTALQVQHVSALRTGGAIVGTVVVVAVVVGVVVLLTGGLGVTLP